MKLSVLVPAYNEEAGLATILRRIAAVPVDKEIIVVNDCSSDRTGAILDGAVVGDRIPGLRVIHHRTNRGKGAAIRTALQAASGDAVIIQDADLEYDPQDYPALLAPILSGEAQVVYGVRNLDAQKLLFRLGNRALTWLTNLLYGVQLHDMETCYKVMTIDIARRLDIESNGFDLEPEITAKIVRLGYTIHEVPIAYEPREEKKLSPWRDGWPALRALLRYRAWRPAPRVASEMVG
ncbi:MAG TPA: glycosyltransferase family 2 protein [Chloroflexi bacterium]|jgi:dolichol-phosphate mannosyltransferase|nr:glycosyltransferase family 2 protein [Chloroflexota bacterium]